VEIATTVASAALGWGSKIVAALYKERAKALRELQDAMTQPMLYLNPQTEHEVDNAAPINEIATTYHAQIRVAFEKFVRTVHSEAARAELDKAWNAYLVDVEGYQQQNSSPLTRFAVIVEPNGVGGFENSNLARIRTFREKLTNIERAAKRVVW
jgi:hypothetical protein